MIVYGYDKSAYPPDCRFRDDSKTVIGPIATTVNDRACLKSLFTVAKEASSMARSLKLRHVDLV